MTNQKEIEQIRENVPSSERPLDALVSPRRFQIIYADPPWWYAMRLNGNTKFGRGAGYYQLMKTHEICSLPVQNICEDQAVLFLWATFPQLPAAFEVMKAWGFRYSTVAFNWIKLNKNAMTYFFGTGYCTKSNGEICLLGWKGKPIKPATNSVSQLIVTPRREHSRKPDEARRGIEMLYPKQSKVELFARKKHEGWDCYGNEVESTITLTATG